MSSRCNSSPVGKKIFFIFTTSYFACLAQVSPLNKEGNTGFHIACANGEERIVRTLLKNLSPTKIGLKSRNMKGETGLDLARNTLDAELCGDIEELMS